MRAPSPVPAGVVLRSLIGAQILVCKISPLVTVTVTVTVRTGVVFKDTVTDTVCSIIEDCSNLCGAPRSQR
jgi:hypothetical protein